MKFQKSFLTLFLIPVFVGCQTSLQSDEASIQNKPNYSPSPSVSVVISNLDQQNKKLADEAKKESSTKTAPKEPVQNRYSIIKFSNDEEDAATDPTVDEIVDDEKLDSVDSAILADSPNDFLFDPDSDKINPLMCNEGLYYNAWVSQFNAEWLTHNKKKFKKIASRNRAMSLARTNEFISLVYPAIEKTGYDFPVVMNAAVLNWIAYFTGVGRKNFVVWLERGQTLIPEMKTILEKNGLPSDLVYLSMIESGYNLSSLSNVGAVGPWQFMPGTARDYKLKINDWLDERRAVDKATEAASHYLSDLYTQFGSWHLAAASYNGGPAMVSRKLRKFGEGASFFDLTLNKKMNSQTANYVPKILAAMIVAKNASLFGFDTAENASSLQTATVPVTRSISIADLAQSIHVDRSVLASLNPQLRLGITPPPSATSDGVYNLVIPASKSSAVLASLNTIPDAPLDHMIAARIKHSEKVSAFAKRYKLTMASVLNSNNNLRSNTSLKKGQVVYISVRLGTGQYDKLTAVKYKHHRSHKVAHRKHQKKTITSAKHAPSTRVAYK